MGRMTNLKKWEAEPKRQPKGTLVAICYSDRCSQRSPKKGIFGVSRIVTEARFGDVDCPRCLHALFWTREEKHEPDTH